MQVLTKNRVEELLEMPGDFINATWPMGNTVVVKETDEIRVYSREFDNGFVSFKDFETFWTEAGHDGYFTE